MLRDGLQFAAVAACAVVLTSPVAASAQHAGWSWPPNRQCRPCPKLCVPGKFADDQEPAADTPQPEVELDFESALASSVGVPSGPSGVPHMIGDSLGVLFFSSRAPFIDSAGKIIYGPGGTGEFPVLSPYDTRGSGVVYENNSAAAVDRHYLHFSHFDDLGSANSTQLRRLVVGVEKRIWEGNASVGVRLPFYMVEPDSLGVGLGNFGIGGVDQVDLGDLTFIFKVILSEDPYSGDVWSAGVAYNAPTGPDTIADVDPVFIVPLEHAGTIQPYCAHLRHFPRGWFAQWFSAIDIPFDKRASTIWFNDIGIGAIFQTRRARGLTAVIPTFEVHVKTPLNNRIIPINSFFNRAQLAQLAPAMVPGALAYEEQVNLTHAITFEFNRSTTLAVGLVSPVASEQIYDWELQVQLNLFGTGYYGPGGPRPR